MKNNNVADIPKDYFEQLKILRNIPENSQKAKDIRDFQKVKNIHQLSKRLENFSEQIRKLIFEIDSDELKQKIYQINDSQLLEKSTKYLEILSKL